MIRIHSDASFARAAMEPDSYLRPLVSLTGHLRDRGIDIASRHGDVALVDACHCGDSFERPTIIVDRTDGGFLWWNSVPGDGEARRVLLDPMVIGLLKVSRYRSLAAHDAPPTDRAFHARLIHGHHVDAVPLGKETVRTAIASDGYRKIHLVPGFWAFDHCDPIAGAPIDFHAPRPLDVFCAATIHYDCPAIAWHRRRALEVLASIRDARVMLGRGRLMPVPIYHRLLQESKICVSPWGYGETCYRDYEALLAGSVLIKPRTDFIDSLLPLDEGRHYFACRPDFADLADVIASVLARWTTLSEHRRECRQYVLDGRRPEWLADRVAEQLTGMIGRFA